MPLDLAVRVMRNLAVLCAVCLFAHAHAQGSADAANKTNNPLNPAPSFNIHSYYSPRLSDSNAHTADFLLRPTLPLAPGKWIGVPQIVRGTLPVSIRPTLDGSYQSGIGDTSLFDIFLLRSRGVQIGAGPLLTIPTATDRSLGTGKWQAGAAAVVVDAKQARLLGMLLQWQHSFAGQSSRPDVQTLTAQPFVIFNLPQGWYLRSTGVWTFDLQHGNYYVPVGFGAGKAWKDGKTIFNAFIEPQYSVLHAGSGVPQWTIFAGLNMNFGR
jgi:hypothetical protein